MTEYIPPIQYGLISITSLVLAFSYFSDNTIMNIAPAISSSPNTDYIGQETIPDDLPTENDELPAKVDDSGNDDIANTVTSSVTKVTDTLKDKLSTINPFATPNPEDKNIEVNESLPIAIARPVQSGGKKRNRSMRNKSKKNKKRSKLNHTKNSKKIK
jgi:hypothetical protein